MEVEQQLAWERRHALAAAAAALVSAFLSFGAFVYFGTQVEGELANDRDTVAAYRDQGDLFITTSAIRAAALLILIPALLYLFRAARARRPEAPPVGFAMAVLGPVLLAAGGLISAVDRVNAADGTGSSARSRPRSSCATSPVG